jgi:hypothetical protein
MKNLVKKFVANHLYYRQVGRLRIIQISVGDFGIEITQAAKFWSLAAISGQGVMKFRREN